MMSDNNFNENNDLDELMKVASEEVEHKDEQVTSFSKLMYITIAITTLTMIGLIFGFVVSIMNTQELEDDTTKPIKQPNLISEQMIPEQEIDLLSEWQFEYPIDVPKWSKQPFDVENILGDEKIYEELIKYAEEFQDIKASTAWMPSGIQGDWEGAPPVFTNKVWEQTLEDGSNNPRYSYTLREDYLIAYTIYIQKLINPVFGEWVFYQRSIPSKPYKDNEKYEIFKKMFSEAWWNTYIKTGEDYTSLPILADWDGDNFGGLEFAEPEPGTYGTFYGVIHETEEDFVTAETIGPDNQGSEMIKISTPIKYVAFDKHKKSIEKYGTIKLILGSNDDVSEANNRVIIMDAELILK